MITRTFFITVCAVMCVNPVDNTVCNITVNIPDKMDKTTAERIIKKKCLTGDKLFVTITGISYSEKLYGMSEQDFLAHAVELDEKRKPIVK